MTSTELSNLARIGKLKAEPPTRDEIAGLRQSAEDRLHDATLAQLSFASRFDLAYNAAHALALIALRHAGFRSDNRYLVFQSLPHTLGTPPEKWRVLAKAHERRNLSEYEGQLERDEGLLAEVIAVAKGLQAEIDNRWPPRA